MTAPVTQTYTAPVIPHACGDFARQGDFAAAFAELCPSGPTLSPVGRPIGIARSGLFSENELILHGHPDILVAREDHLLVTPLFNMPADGRDALSRALGYHVCDFSPEMALQEVFDSDTLPVEDYSEGFRLFFLGGSGLLMPDGYPKLLHCDPESLEMPLHMLIPDLAAPGAHTRLGAADKARHALDLLSHISFLNTHPGRRVRFQLEAG